MRSSRAPTKRNKVLAALRPDAKVNEIAAACGCSAHYVRQVIAGARAGATQRIPRDERRRVMPDTLREMLRLYSRGESINAIAMCIGRHYDIVTRWIQAVTDYAVIRGSESRTAMKQPRAKRWTDDEVASAIEMSRRGISEASIASELSRTPMAVRHIITRHRRLVGEARS